MANVITYLIERYQDQNQFVKMSPDGYSLEFYYLNKTPKKVKAFAEDWGVTRLPFALIQTDNVTRGVYSEASGTFVENLNKIIKEITELQNGSKS